MSVKRRLHSDGLKRSESVKKTILEKKNKLKRLNWTQQHKDWTLEDWKKVQWTDESKFLFFRWEQTKSV